MCIRDRDRVTTAENKTQKVEEIKHVEAVIDDESDEQDQPEEEDDKDPQVEEKEKAAEDDTTKEEKKDGDIEAEPEKQEEAPLEHNSANGIKEGSHASSDLGFPAFEDGSDDGGDI